MERTFTLTVTESEENGLDIVTKSSDFSPFEIIGFLEAVKQTALKQIEDDYDAPTLDINPN